MADRAATSGPKDELLNQAARDYKALQETLTGLNEAQMTEVWLGTWSVKDIVAHISGWHREMGPALERLARGEKPVPVGVPSERFEPGKTAWKLVDGNSAHHYREHAQQIRAWRRSRGVS